MIRSISKVFAAPLSCIESNWCKKFLGLTLKPVGGELCNNYSHSGQVVVCSPHEHH